MNVNTTMMIATARHTWLLVLAAALLLPSACVLQPYNGQALESRESATHFQGSTVVPDDVVELQYLNPSSGQFETFATTQTIAEQSITLGGTIHYVWALTTPIPSYAWQYTGNNWEAKVRVFWPLGGTVLTTFDPGASACFEEYENNLFDVLNYCDSTESPVITLNAPY